MPWEVAWGTRPPTFLTSAEKLAFYIVFGELDGGEWDYQYHNWKERK